MAKGKKRSRKRKGSNIRPFLTWAAVLVFTGAFVYSFFALETKPLDPVTMCPSDGPIGVTAVVLDLSDQLTPAQQAKLSRLLNSTELPIIGKGERLDVYLMPEDKKIPNKLISMCNPGSIKTATNIDRFNKANRMFQIEWNKFVDSKANVLKKLESNSVGSTSPISETINYVTSSSFPSSDITLKNSQNYKMVIISDMLQNSNNLSVFRKNISAKDKVGHALFYGGETYVYQLMSDKYKDMQTKNLLLFWETQISKAGSSLMRWEKW